MSNVLEHARTPRVGPQVGLGKTTRLSLTSGQRSRRLPSCEKQSRAATVFPLLVFLPIESVEAVTSALASLSRQRSRGVVSKAAVHGNAAVQISRLSASVHQRKARHTYFTYRSVAVRVSVLVLHEQVSKWLRCQGQRGSLPLPGARRPSRMISTSRGQRPLAGPTVA